MNKDKKSNIYYQIDNIIVEDDKSIELIKEITKLQKIGIENDELTGAYKQLACKIRRELQIKNCISFNIAVHKITNKEYLSIVIYDYELPDEDWNCWIDAKYDKDKKLRYVEIKEDKLIY